MKHFLLPTAFALLALCSCRKDKSTQNNSSLSDARTVLLKSIIEPGLPNLYFSFAYDQNKFVTGIAFADSMQVYALSYNNKRLSKLTSKWSGETLDYVYTGNNVSYIIHKDQTGNKTFSYVLKYYPQGLLQSIEWFRFTNINDSVCTRRAELAYAADGNLSIFKDYRNHEAANDGLKLTLTHLYSHYDDGVNVNDIALFKDFFGQLLFLPQVKLQKNNPGLELIQGETTDYRQINHFEYQQGLPVNNTGTLTVTRGTNTGESFPFSMEMKYF